MEDIITLLIYLAILVLGGVASTLRKKKAAKKPNDGQIEDYPPPAKRFPSPFDPFEEIIRELESKKDPEYEEEPEMPKSVVPERNIYREEVVRNEPILETIPEYEAKSLEEPVDDTKSLEQAYVEQTEIKDFIKQTNYNHGEIQSGEITDTIKDFDYDKIETETFTFDLKKAVIYSEILKRKDF